MDLIDPTTLTLVSRALDAASLRQMVHAHNISQAHVEGFTPSRVEFESQLEAARSTLARGGRLGPSDVAELGPQVRPQPAGTAVALDAEVTALSQNGLHYQALIRALNSELTLLSLAVSDGRR